MTFLRLFLTQPFHPKPELWLPPADGIGTAVAACPATACYQPFQHYSKERGTVPHQHTHSAAHTECSEMATVTRNGAYSWRHDNLRQEKSSETSWPEGGWVFFWFYPNLTLITWFLWFRSSCRAVSGRRWVTHSPIQREYQGACV